MTRTASVATPRGLLEPRLSFVVLLVGAVLLFRAAALVSPSSSVVVPGGLALPLNGLGLVFLASGVVPWLARPSSLTRVFLVYGVGGAVHWGGTVAAPSPEVELSLLVFYVAATAAGDGAFLDFSRRYPRSAAGSSIATAVLYLPALLTLSATPLAAFLPRRAVEVGLGMILAVAFLMSIAAGIAFLAKWFRATRHERGEQRLTAICFVLIATSVVDLLAEVGVLPEPREAWSLLYALVPLTLGWALVRPVRRDPPPVPSAGSSATQVSP